MIDGLCGYMIDDSCTNILERQIVVHFFVFWKISDRIVRLAVAVVPEYKPAATLAFISDFVKVSVFVGFPRVFDRNKCSYP